MSKMSKMCLVLLLITIKKLSHMRPQRFLDPYRIFKPGRRYLPHLSCHRRRLGFFMLFRFYIKGFLSSNFRQIRAQIGN